MARFTFRYETLLQHRRNIEDQRQRELAEQVRMQMIMKDQLRDMQQGLSSSKRDLGEALVGKVDLTQVGGFTRFNAQATTRGYALVRKLAEVQIKVDTARGQLLQATQQSKALEVLRDRDLADWRRQQQRLETAEMDELAAQAYARRLLSRQRLREPMDSSTERVA